MKKLLTIIFTLVAASSFGFTGFNGPQYNTYHNPNATSNNAYIQPQQNTIIRHQDGTNTYIQNNGNSGVIRYSDGSVDYVQYR